VAWEQRKATRRKMQRDAASSPPEPFCPFPFPSGLSLSPFLPPFQLIFSVLVVFFPAIVPPSFSLDFFRASTIYLRASNKKK